MYVVDRFAHMLPQLDFVIDLRDLLPMSYKWGAKLSIRDVNIVPEMHHFNFWK